MSSIILGPMVAKKHIIQYMPARRLVWKQKTARLSERDGGMSQVLEELREGGHSLSAGSSLSRGNQGRCPRRGDIWAESRKVSDIVLEDWVWMPHLKTPRMQVHGLLLCLVQILSLETLLEKNRTEVRPKRKTNAGSGVEEKSPGYLTTRLSPPLEFSRAKAMPVGTGD